MLEGRGLFSSPPLVEFRNLGGTVIKIHDCDREYGFLKIRRVILIHKEVTPRAIMMGKNAIYFFDATKINK